MRLGVNIDHVATLRQARNGRYPDPVAAAALAELGGADQITLHVREDRRHVNDRDLEILRKTVNGTLNLEMAAVQPMLELALQHRPDTATLVPERRQELTTEGGLDVASGREEIRKVARALRDAGVEVSLFVDPDLEQVAAGHRLDYWNVKAVAEIQEIAELNIGYAIVCRAVLVGIERAVRDMKDLIG